MTPKALEPVERLADALFEQMENEEAQSLPSSMQREKGLVWLEGWFDLHTALEAAQPLPDIEKVAERIERLLPAIEADGHLTCSRLVRRLIEDIEKVAKQ